MRSTALPGLGTDAPMVCLRCGGPLSGLAAGRSVVLTDADVDFADRGRRLQLCGLAGEVERGRGACRIQFTEVAYGLAGGQRLHGHAPLLQLLDRVRIGPHAAVGTGPHDQMRRKFVQDLNQVVEDERVAVSAPPVPHHPVGQDDEILGLLASVDDDPPELVVVDPRHPTTPRGSVASRPPG
jgi:hypothetical protein